MTKEMPAQEESRETTPDPSPTPNETVVAPEASEVSEKNKNIASTDSTSIDMEKNAPETEAVHASSARNTSPEAATSSYPQSSAVEHTGFAARCFDVCAMFGPVILVFLWIVQSLPGFAGRSSQTLFDLAFRMQGELTTHGMETAKQVSDVSSFLYHPVWYWIQTWLQQLPESVTSLPARIPGFPPNSVLDPLSLATAGTTLCLILLTWGFAKAIGKEKQDAFGAGLVLLSSLTWIGLPTPGGRELLLASILTLSLLCLYRGWIKAFAPLWLIVGFALIAPATVEGGLLGLLLPLICSLFFLLWRGSFRRAGAYDGALAFGIMLILLCLWGTCIAFGEGRDALYMLLDVRFRIPFIESVHTLGQNGWVLFPVLALLWLPWTLVVLFVPWQRLGAFFTGFIRNRKEHPGQGWLWCWLFVGLALLYGLETNTPELLIPLLPPLAVLTAQGILSLSPRSSSMFMALISLLLFLIGLLFALIALWPMVLGELPPILTDIQIMPLSLNGILVRTGIPFLFAFLLWKGTNRFSPKGSLLVFCLLTLLLALPRAWYAGAAEISNPRHPIPAASVKPTPSLPADSLSEKVIVPSSSENSALEKVVAPPTEQPEPSVQEPSSNHKEVPDLLEPEQQPLSLPQPDRSDSPSVPSEENNSDQPTAKPILSDPLPKVPVDSEPNAQ